MFDDKIESSKKALRLAAEMSLTYYGKPLVVCFSGGKDSSVLLHLSENCLKPNEYKVLYSHTSVDAPQTVHFIREQFERLRGGVLRLASARNTTKRYQGIAIRSIARA